MNVDSIPGAAGAPALGTHPLSPASLLTLFAWPRRFFSSDLPLGERPALLIVIGLVGLAQVIDRFDRALMKADFGAEDTNGMVALLQGSWLWVWVAAVALAVLSGAFAWYVGGWWYGVRLRWSQAVDPDPRQGRLVYAYAGLVVAIPTVFLMLLNTVLHPSYAAAFQHEAVWPALLLIFPFWSVFVSYQGVRASFDVDGRRAALWFGVLPTLVYLVALGAVSALYIAAA